MDSAADSLLALSTIAAATAATDEPVSDDDHSSSLSELDEDLDDAEEEEDLDHPAVADGDSEAETERLQITPENLAKKKPFEITPSKLAQRQDVDMRPEIESLTESAVSSPISSHADSDNEGQLSDVPEADAIVDRGADVAAETSPNKRKREDSESDEEGPRSQRMRTGSVESEDEKSEPESDAEEAQNPHSRELTIEPEAEVREPDEEEVEEPEEEIKETDKVDTSEDSKDKGRSRHRRKAKGDAQEPTAEDEEDAEAAEDSEAVDENDAEAAAKSEEEQAKRLAAMEALTALEKHFAALRDRLYDERIAAINQELQLLSESKSAHPELMRQVEVVQKYRDEKFEVDQKLLVYKIGALKNKTVAERSQIHSQYFQTVRDVRERHLERISEHFYRIQRDRFKTDSAVPSFTIPFPERRSQQIIQQTAYNKEVSILSGVAKYVGFPAAPELASTRQKDVEEDMQKMGISPAQLRPIRPTPRSAGQQAQMSGHQAEEQFLEQTPWANPQHPIHRLSRQNSSRSPMNEFLTPANQQRTVSDGQQPPGGSASTIVDPSASAQASSVINTPLNDGQQGSAARIEQQAGSVNAHNYQMQSTSPLDTRHPLATDLTDPQSTNPSKDKDLDSSPLTSRAYLSNSANAPRAAEKLGGATRVRDNSPFRQPASSTVTAGSGNSGGFSGTGRFSIR